jgi:hypothetical protein
MCPEPLHILSWASTTWLSRTANRASGWIPTMRGRTAGSAWHTSKRASTRRPLIGGSRKVGNLPPKPGTELSFPCARLGLLRSPFESKSLPPSLVPGNVRKTERTALVERCVRHVVVCHTNGVYWQRQWVSMLGFPENGPLVASCYDNINRA